MFEKGPGQVWEQSGRPPRKIDFLDRLNAALSEHVQTFYQYKIRSPGFS